MAYTTKKSLLEEIRNGNGASWSEFEQTYRPLILLRGKDYKLSAQEKEELCQQVLLDVFKGSSRFQYQPEKGRFRDYLRRVISRNAIDLVRMRKSPPPSFLRSEEESNAPFEALWEQEWRSHLLTQALQKLRSETEPRTYQAFHLYVIEETSADEVARFLGITRNAVYMIKNRALSRLKRILAQIQEA